MATAGAGYSGTPLQKKLGLKERFAVAFAGEVPDWFAASFDGLIVKPTLRAPLDAVVLFTTPSPSPSSPSSPSEPNFER